MLDQNWRDREDRQDVRLQNERDARLRIDHSDKPWEQELERRRLLRRKSIIFHPWGMVFLALLLIVFLSWFFGF